LIHLHELDFKSAETLAREALRRSPEYHDAQDVLALLPRVRNQMLDPDHSSSEPIVRACGRFRVAVLAGRRPDALALGAQLLQAKTAPRQSRRDAAEYWARFGPPQKLDHVLATDGPAADVLDESLVSVVRTRREVASELLAAWPNLNCTGP
jgi:hypothetical protein